MLAGHGDGGVGRDGLAAVHPAAELRALLFGHGQLAVRLAVRQDVYKRQGQFDSSRVYAEFRRLDQSRIVDTTSGWFRCGETDVDSRHIYFGPWRLRPGEKPLVLTEFGGCCLAVPGHMFHPEKTYGYSTSENREALKEAILKLYETRILPAVQNGLCAAIYTQLSDVEDEINGLVTYDRRTVKTVSYTHL